MKRPIVLTLLASALVFTAACGGRQHDDFATYVDNSPFFYMGDLEEQARNYLMDCTLILGSNLNDPEAGFARLEAMFRLNGDAMIQNARDVEARFDTFEGAERELYSREFARFMEDAYTDWRETKDEFRRVGGETGLEMERMVERFDANR